MLLLRGSEHCSQSQAEGAMSEMEGMHSNILVELAMFAGSFVGLAIVCDDHMVVALETLCVRWNVSLVCW